MTAPHEKEELMATLSVNNKPVRSRTLADQVAADLHVAILQGEFEGGAHLRINDLAERFDTSQMPVREALRKLSALGVVEILPHKGARVLALSVEDLDDVSRVRRLLEGHAIREAAVRFTPEHEKEASEALDRHVALLETGDVEAARRAHTDFHLALYKAADSRWLLHAIEPVWQNTERYRFTLSRVPSVNSQSYKEHLRILNACVAHDPDEAHRSLCEHLDGAYERMKLAMGNHEDE